MTTDTPPITVSAADDAIRLALRSVLDAAAEDSPWFCYASAELSAVVAEYLALRAHYPEQVAVVRQVRVRARQQE